MRLAMEMCEYVSGIPRQAELLAITLIIIKTLVKMAMTTNTILSTDMCVSLTHYPSYLLLINTELIPFP
jgi:hypothetical protein